MDISTTETGDGYFMRFVVDSMLGKLARWLRIMGYDAHYQNTYTDYEISRLVAEGRCLLTRDTTKAHLLENTVVLSNNNIGNQLHELKQKISLSPHHSQLFTRCLLCNTLLQKPRLDSAAESVPEYVFYTKSAELKYCPSCGRHYWPGTHRERMAQKLIEWGLIH